MALLEKSNFEDEFSHPILEGLSALERKLLIDLIRQRHHQLWSKFRSNGYGWNTAKQHLNEFINHHLSEFTEELEKAGFNHNGFFRTARGKGEAYVNERAL
ncbi:hypothetical protein G4O51_11160 [Candidatus Bathyarchaeota archaeon A05DMB-2]|jgi:hypothetical protein|nr:hypothetical protein [Candidatus Bathyarchaeota archaeon A05DMB-2]MDH7564621.1 hypothetical protein [Candidatus Bathyarchaeota archaeon]